MLSDGMARVMYGIKFINMKYIFFTFFLFVLQFCFGQNEVDRRLDKWDFSKRFTEKEFYEMYPQFKNKFADPIMYDIPYHIYKGHKVDTLSCDSIMNLYIVEVQIEKNVYMTFSIPKK